MGTLMQWYEQHVAEHAEASSRAASCNALLMYSSSLVGLGVPPEEILEFVREAVEMAGRMQRKTLEGATLGEAFDEIFSRPVLRPIDGGKSRVPEEPGGT